MGIRKLYVVGLLCFSMQAIAQKDNVGIGTLQPDRSAVLEIQSPNKGLLIPRMSVSQRNAIPQPANGLLVYQTDAASGFYFFNGREWKPLGSSIPEVHATANVDGWLLNGNPNATANSFIGVPTGVPIRFRIGTSTAGSIGSTDNFYLGLLSGARTAATGGLNLGLGAYTLSTLSSGFANTAIGFTAMQFNTTGRLNLAIGALALRANTTGSSNVAIGHGSMNGNTTGENNISIGKDAMFVSNGNTNVAIGASALTSLTNGNNNLAIGYFAGQTLSTGSGNIFLGTESGRNETGSNKLYIANSATTTPLVYGDFSAKFISIGDVPVAKRDAIASAGQYGLLVKGGIMTEKIKVALASTNDWADYVFTPEYQDNMMSLEQVEAFIQKNKHLPNVPSAAQMAEEGLDVTQTSAKLLEKIEELTLYMIEMKKEIKSLQEENKRLKKRAEK